MNQDDATNSTGMRDLLQVPSIVRDIAILMNVTDYVKFRQLNKDVYEKILNQDFDNKLWISKLECLELIKVTETSGSEGTEEEPETNEGTEETLISLANEELKVDNLNATNVFDIITNYKESESKVVFQKFYSIFNNFCSKLYHNNLAHFFPTKFEKDPISQAKILRNISRYNKINKSDFEYYEKVEQNLVILKEIFINSVLQEAEKNYQYKDYKATAVFIDVLLLSDEEVNAVEFFKSKIDLTVFENWLPENLFSRNENNVTNNLEESEQGNKHELEDPNELTDQAKQFNENLFIEALEPLKSYLNEVIDIVDILFEDKYPIILNVIESFVQEVILKPIDNLIKSHEENIVEYFPKLYSLIKQKLCTELHDSKNGGVSFHKIVLEFFNMYLEDNIVKFLNLTPMFIQSKLQREFREYDEKVRIEELQKNEEIYNSLRDQSTITTDLGTDKNDFLSSFTKIFKLSHADNDRQAMEEQLKLAYNLNTITNNLENIKSLVSLDLCYNVVQQVKESIDEMSCFANQDSVSHVVKAKCQAVFKILVNLLCDAHVKPAFEKGTHLLQEYDPTQLDKIDLNLKGVDGGKVEPLVKFTELMNICDIILQMISIFYKNELLAKNIIDKNRDFLNDVVQVKKKFETVVDDFVAEGLNIGINKLMDRITFAFNTLQMPDDYNPDVNSDNRTLEIKPTQCAIQVIDLLHNHCFLLNGATDKGTIDVYQQEIGERFFNEVVKHIKGSLISTEGGITLICDLNYYYDFFSKKLKQKSLLPLYQGLKNIGQLYIISGKDSKELGKMISDLGKFQGLFTQEEIYEFVQRRSDWIRVKRDVEKVMYGLGVKDCVIM
ncbi:Recyclin-1 [Nakaseomyces bracarensis]|uniref:Recyclin-1 n=1 Tax=Nakaseomyces bracarensis TaxID=273131 RepID=A0ABR4NQT0_9SACH